MKIPTLKFLRQRKFLLRLPWMVLPFVLVIFFFLGGGQGTAMAGNKNSLKDGLNVHLPDPHFGNGKEKDKWSSYETLLKDSSKIREAMKNDPYYHLPDSETDTRSMVGHEKKIISKLAEINTVISQEKKITAFSQRPKNDPGNSTMQSEKMMTERKNSFSRDPEIERLNGMLDKLLAIQHPESVQSSPKTPTYTVEVKVPEKDLTDWGGEKIKDAGSFFELEESGKSKSPPSQIPQAVIPETKSLVTGSTVKLELKNEVIIQGIELPAGQFIYGVASISNERLHIHIASIRHNQFILPVSLDVYDLDGLEGIYIPGSIPREVSKQSADQSIAGIGLGTLDPSLGAQAASAGIQAAKTLFSRKLKLVKVRVLAGYQVLLKDSHQNNF